MEGWDGSHSSSYGVAVNTVYTTPKPRDPLEEASDQELVFELLKRGYAVAKMDPQDLAESLK